MLMTVDAALDEPLYLQIRNQIVAGIATGQLEPGQSLPSVRTLASDLGINLHTVNKAYAVLRDEGYVTMRGRAGARVADPAAADRAGADEAAQTRMEDDLFKLALAFRARGGARGAFLEAAAAQAARAYGVAANTSASAGRSASAKKAPGRSGAPEATVRSAGSPRIGIVGPGPATAAREGR